VSGNWNIRIVTDWDEIYSRKFQEKWLSWAENEVNSHVFFHPVLCMAWLETYRPLRKLDPLFCIAENETGTLFLPLVIWHRNWKNAFQKLIVPVGYSDFDYHEPYRFGTNDKFEWESVLSCILKRISETFSFDFLEINGILTEMTGDGWSKEEQVAPFCDLTDFNSIEEYLQSLKTSLRGDIRRQLRRMEEVGTISLVEYSNLPEVLDVLPGFLQLHKERWPKAYKAPGFHENLVRYGLESGIVHFSVLKAGNEVLSYHLGFKYSGVYYYYMPAIESRFENLSPGKIHLYKLVEYAINNSFRVFDHLRGDENYKAGWTKQVKSLYRFSSMSGRAVSKYRNKLVSLKNRF